ncbi:hypothetical protein Ahy_A06g027971 [Arachis hypogaea]|uniref:Aminotransferase-like plant mobile domain-containing protein n=1 Tax=Arachis hypogaea TaxID=3818 RepID=A0A445CQ62_ARAHY|nr:hypothetical protein Ahy_A06g027971 [Arachis hypogaea]
MHIPLMNQPHKLLKKLAYSFNMVSNRLDTWYVKLFLEKVNFKDLSEEDKEVVRRFQGKTLKNLMDEMMDLRVFILYVQMAFLLPTTINKVFSVHIPPIFYLDNVREWNWGSHVLKFFIKDISEHHLKKKKFIDGCFYALMIVYFHETKHKNKNAYTIPGPP